MSAAALLALVAGFAGLAVLAVMGVGLFRQVRSLGRTVAGASDRLTAAGSRLPTAETADTADTGRPGGR